MKCPALIFGFLICTSVASAQQVVTATVQMQCHDLSTNGNFLGPDEVLLNGMACKQVKPNAAPKQNLVPSNAAPVAQPAPANVAVAAPEPLAPVNADAMNSTGS